jgi:RNA polymerase sigma-70 factor (ECF subfamily)
MALQLRPNCEYCDKDLLPNATIATGSDSSVEKAQRFRVEALPYLNDVYTVACYLLHNADDAEDATQECYLRAFRHFEKFRGSSIKPWLFTILRNVCRAEYARRGALAAMTTESLDAAEPS